LPSYPFPKKLMEDLRLDLSGHHSQRVNREIFIRFDLIIVMEEGQKEALRIEYPEINQKIFMLTEFSGRAVYDIPDPVGETEDKKTEVVMEINRLITDGFQEICNRAVKNNSMSNLKNEKNK
jgi:protein-tyrosine-phosphatase